MLFTLNETASIANNFMQELRDITVQNDRMRFRKNIERLGEIMAYEVSRKLSYRSHAVATPLGRVMVQVLDQQPVLITVMRAGLPFFQGFLNFFDKADCAFIGAYRQETPDQMTIKLEYFATTDVNNRTVILIDPMLATGRSVIDSLDALLKKGLPAHIHIVSLIAAPEGLAWIKKKLRIPYSLWTCAVDEKLDENYFIVPGLGDAGDLSYGAKI
jgi:uracil phosphoribosyltransferase